MLNHAKLTKSGMQRIFKFAYSEYFIQWSNRIEHYITCYSKVLNSHQTYKSNTCRGNSLFMLNDIGCWPGRSFICAWIKDMKVSFSVMCWKGHLHQVHSLWKVPHLALKLKSSPFPYFYFPEPVPSTANVSRQIERLGERFAGKRRLRTVLFYRMLCSLNSMWKGLSK